MSYIVIHEEFSPHELLDKAEESAKQAGLTPEELEQAIPEVRNKDVSVILDTNVVKAIHVRPAC